MPASAARASFISQEFRSNVWSNPTVRTLYGKVARDTGDAPIDTFFDEMSAVQARNNERAALLGAHARAFRVKVDELVDLDGAFAMISGLPGVRVVDAELAADMACAVVSIESYDTGSGQTVLACWGTM